VPVIEQSLRPRLRASPTLINRRVDSPTRWRLGIYPASGSSCEGSVNQRARRQKSEPRGLDYLGGRSLHMTMTRLRRRALSLYSPYKSTRMSSHTFAAVSELIADELPPPAV
jgi:hypothetical protein